MAMEEIRLWAVDGSNGAVELATAGRMESERLLEETLVNKPDLLLPGLTLVGRQMPTEGGPLDLLGVDDDGRLVVFELKRGTLSRDAVAQVIDYASYLDSLDESELARYISDRSGARGTVNIEDFEAWYDDRWSEQGLGSLRPVRMALVGLGVDEPTNRMVRFLATNGVDITLLTFHGYAYDGKTLLARQVRVEPDMHRESAPGRRSSQSERLEQLKSRIREQTEQWEEGHALWNVVHEMFREGFCHPVEGTSRRNTDWAKYRLNLHIRRGGRGAYAAVQLIPWDRRLEVIFFPKSVALRLDEFTQLRQEIPFCTWPQNSPEKDAGVIEVKFLLDSLAEWEQHKEKLTNVTQSVYQAVVNGEAE